MSLKETIIHESLKRFSLKGFESTSLHDILSTANASKGGFYNHFASKEDLFHDVLLEARKIWRKRNLSGLGEVKKSINALISYLEDLKS